MTHSPVDDDDAKLVSQWLQMYDTVITVYKGQSLAHKVTRNDGRFLDLKP